jgi:hypothetical protein
MAHAWYAHEAFNETLSNNHMLLNFSEHATILKLSALNN